MTDNASALQNRFLVACAVAREAGALARRRFLDRGSFTIGFKGPQDFITEVDGEVERLIQSRVTEIFPDDGFIGEEGDGLVGKPGAPVWVVDPIDGTSNFARGTPHWCVSIACVLGRAVEVGVIYDPMLDELFCARRNAGAWLNGAPIRAAATTELGKATIEVGWNMRYGLEKFLALLARTASTGSGVIRAGSGALGLAYVAAGRRDGYVENHINSWDCLAGNLLVAEAGGYVSDFLAGEGLRKGNPLVACAAGVKTALIKAAAIEGLAL
ncbi:inositol monophosphatase family protein [Methylocapsa sp. S129]|uniref:inositol monophosphatase family protein n=1 Tax=Methylocapsa sp. S129 TaxID=1641869 RepID=UPI001FEE546D|nr:inositol monophosphatase family protein [Methylocapsa sp. S129]